MTEATSVSVLVVDDEHLVLTSVAEALRAAGFEVRTADSGKEAVRMANTNPPDVIITDLRMPEIDGLALVDRVGAVSRIVIYTATPVTPELSSLAPEARWVEKTTDHRELIATLREC